jgi:hypothetical protein
VVSFDDMSAGDEPIDRDLLGEPETGTEVTAASTPDSIHDVSLPGVADTADLEALVAGASPDTTAPAGLSVAGEAGDSAAAMLPSAPEGEEVAVLPAEVTAEVPPPIAIVPSSLLAHMLMTERGVAEPDSGLMLFRSQAEERQYYKARVFVNDVYEVVGMHEVLSERFGVRSNQARVKEVQKYRSILDFLVNVLSVIGIVIAFATVWIVFHDISERKKGMIGTLRIMGLSRGGVLTLLLTQGVLIALISAALLVVLGFGAAWLINLIVNQAACVLLPTDFVMVAAAIVVVCVLGTYFPARAVSRVDPVVALRESQKR